MTRKTALVTLCFALMALTACTGNAQNQKEATTQQQWREIEPADINRNAVSLFADDWMALAVGNKDEMNAMTIAWGSLGELWGRPVVTVYVSGSRYTYQLMERNDDFTVTAFPDGYRNALMYLGTKSGRNEDKMKGAGLTTEFTQLGNPIFREGNLAIEYRMLYKQELALDDLPDDIKSMYDGGRAMKPHMMYIGEILHVWVKE